MKPHKHAELIKAWADGALIEYWSKTTKQWTDVEAVNPYWRETTEYRIKPVQDVVRSFRLECHSWVGIRFNESSELLRKEDEQWIRVLFDGKTCKIKSVEVL